VTYFLSKLTRRQVRLDTPGKQRPTKLVTVVAFVSAESFRRQSGLTRPERINGRQCQSDVVAVGGTHRDRERCTVAVAQNGSVEAKESSRFVCTAGAASPLLLATSEPSR